METREAEINGEVQKQRCTYQKMQVRQAVQKNIRILKYHVMRPNKRKVKNYASFMAATNY